MRSSPLLVPLLLLCCIEFQFVSTVLVISEASYQETWHKVISISIIRYTAGCDNSLIAAASVQTTISTTGHSIRNIKGLLFKELFLLRMD